MVIELVTSTAGRGVQGRRHAQRAEIVFAAPPIHAGPCGALAADGAGGAIEQEGRVTSAPLHHGDGIALRAQRRLAPSLPDQQNGCGTNSAGFEWC